MNRTDPLGLFQKTRISRREMLRISGLHTVALSLGRSPIFPIGQGLGATTRAASRLKITGIEVFEVSATPNTKWVFIRLKTNLGLTGLGEASLGETYETQELNGFFDMVRERSPFEIEAYRQRGRELARSGSRPMAAAFSAIEQAQWDLAGKALDVPVYDLFGGKLRNDLRVYANINRAVVDRSSGSFAASAGRAVVEGFHAIKAAPFSPFPQLEAPEEDIERASEKGIACVAAMRKTVGPDVKLKIDCHRAFDVELAVEIARRLEPYALSWYEEPVSPETVSEIKKIKSAIKQRVAGGEKLFGMEGFAGLCRSRAVDVIMPDVRYCGGIMEGRRIAAMAELEGNILVSPHNPCGPVATAASVQLCAGMPNFSILEYQWNEVPWRSELVTPPEQIQNGRIPVPDRPGLGIELNEQVVREHALVS